MMVLMGLVGCVSPIELIPPTGDRPIGEATTIFTDAARDEALGEGPRAVTVQVWYPADPPTEVEPAPYVPEVAALRPALTSREQRLFAHVDVHAVLDAAPAADPEPWPVVVLSHGDDRISAEYSFLSEELASHGYVVVAVDHPYDARAALDGRGEAVGYAEEAWPPLPPVGEDGRPDPASAYAAFYRERVDVRVADARFALDRLGADGIVPLTADHLDLDRVAFVGHSVGGVAAGTFCQEDLRALACVNLDGESPDGPFTGDGLAPPYLMLTKPFAPTDDQIGEWGLTRAEWEANYAAWLDSHFGAVDGGSWRVTLDGASHESFSDEPWVLAALLGDDTSAPAAHLELVRAYVLAFVDRFLRDAPGSLLDDPAPGGAAVQAWPASG